MNLLGPNPVTSKAKQACGFRLELAVNGTIKAAQNTGTGCPERLWSLYPWTYSTLEMVNLPAHSLALAEPAWSREGG